MENDYRRFIEVWVARFIRQPVILKRFVRTNDFRDDDIAEFLGLLEGDGDFERQKQVESLPREERRQMVLQASKAILEDATNRPLPAYLKPNFATIGDLLSLNPVERKLLCLLAFLYSERIMTDCFNLLKNLSKRQFSEILALMLDQEFGEVQRALTPDRPIIGSALARWRVSPQGHHVQFLDDSLPAALLSGDMTLDGVLKAIARRAPAPTLQTSDYAGLGDLIPDVRRFLRQALSEKQCGVNLFLHGPPGTGKTELSRVLARELKVPLYEVAFEDSNGDPIVGQNRLEALRSSQCLLGQQRALLVFDEAEDVFAGHSVGRAGAAQITKAWTNRILESNPIPTIWISNSVGSLDPAFVRRFDFMIELKAPPRRERRKTYEKLCADLVSPPLLDRLAGDPNLSPAVVARTAQVVRSVREDHDSDELFAKLVCNTLKAQGHSTKTLEMEPRVPPVFALDYLNTALPLAPIADELAANPNCRICLYGPPGTGKTTFGHWLAECLGIPVHAKKASDILSPFIGMAERHLARVFEEARDEQSLLLIDEVDTFLQDRRGAVRSWEVSLVNEFLTQVEQFEGVLVVSTNLMDGIDQAALRRFDLKVRVDYLHAAQSVALAESWCTQLAISPLDPTSRLRLEKLTNLTPGDFGNVARQHRFRRFPDAAALVEALEYECASKEGRRGKLGFSG